jgi:hypothetical protein
MDGHPKQSAAKRVRNEASINVDNVSVKLSPKMLQALARIEAAVHDSKHFDSDIKRNLQDYAGGTPFSSSRMAFSGIATITQETMRHIDATNDPEARQALNGFINEFYQEEEKGTPSFTLVPSRAQSR